MTGHSSTMQQTAQPQQVFQNIISKEAAHVSDDSFATSLDNYSLEAVVDAKLTRFFDQIGSFYPENVHEIIMKKVEKPLVNQILRRVGGNQVHASRILGINRNTLRKKMKMYDL